MTTVCRGSATTTAVLVLLRLSSAQAWAEERTELVADGQPAATIVAAEQPSPAAQLAAFELEYHVEQITGATLPIVREPSQPEGLPIPVGPSRAAAARRSFTAAGPRHANERHLQSVRQPLA